MSTVNETASPWTEDELAALATLSAIIIPESTTHGLPAADDPQILAAILADAARHHAALSGPLAEFARTADGTPEARGAAFRQAHAAAARLIQTVVAQCYYRDDRVMRSLAMEVRPPFPVGYQVEQGDWSLLDPVRARPPLYRPDGSGE